MKKRVRFLDSIAGLADPKPAAELDEKYRQVRDSMKKPSPGREKGASDYTVASVIEETKKRDRYGEPALGFARDWAFKPGDEAAIDGKLAEKWEAAGICTVLEDAKKAA